MITNQNDIAAGLYDWAGRSNTREAAAELLVYTLGGRLILGPWVHLDNAGNVAFDANRAMRASRDLGDEERRVLHLAATLADPEWQISLGDLLPGTDDATFEAIVKAMSRAAGIRA